MLPRQSGFSLLSPLTGLQTLTLKYPLNFLESIPTLQALAFLRGLQILSLDLSDTHSQANTAALDAALVPLTALTRVQLFCTKLSSLPPSLASLPHLQRFGYDRGSRLTDVALPFGPWLASLRRLVVPAAVVANSHAQLLAAPQLECLGFSMNSFCELSVPQQSRVLSLDASLPSLSTLGFGCRTDSRATKAHSTLDINTVAQVAALAQRMPELRFEWRYIALDDLLEEA